MFQTAVRRRHVFGHMSLRHLSLVLSAASALGGRIHWDYYEACYWTETYSRDDVQASCAWRDKMAKITIQDGACPSTYGDFIYEAKFGMNPPPCGPPAADLARAMPEASDQNQGGALVGSAATLDAPDGTCSEKGDCGLAYEACCAVSVAQGIPCTCHLADGTGKSAADCGTCGTAYSACCMGFAAKGIPCTCDINGGATSLLV